MDYRRNNNQGSGGPDRNRNNYGGGRPYDRNDKGGRGGGGGYRRPYERNRHDQRDREQDRAQEEVNDIEKRLGGLIIRVGDKITPTLETNLNTLAGILDNDYAKHSATILKSLKACILELPMKSAIYGTLTGLLNAKNMQTGGTIVTMASDLLQDNLAKHQWRNVKLLLRFFGELVNANVILPTTLLNVMNQFLAVLEEETVIRARADCAVYCVLATLPWCAADMRDRNPHDFEKILGRIEDYMLAREEGGGAEGFEITKVFKDSDCPYIQEEPLTLLWKQIQNLQKDDWDVSILIKPSQTFDAVLGMASQHELPPFVFPPHTDTISYYTPAPLLRIFLSEDEEQQNSLPDPYSIAHFIVRDNLTDVLCLFEINRKECAKYLFMVQYSYVIGTFADSTAAAAAAAAAAANNPVAEDMETDVPTGPGWSVDQVLAEVIFTELFKLPKPEFKTVYYASLLVEVCKSFPDSFPAALAVAINRLFDRLPSMDIECAHRFWTWFSHHLSNFGYLWDWNQWAAALEVPFDDPKSVFIRETLEKTIRLSYFERIREALPEEFQKMIPAEAPGPSWKFENPEHPYHAMASAVLNSLRAKNSIEQIEQTLESMKNAPRLESLTMTEREDFIRELFTECVLMLGSKSFSHVLNVIERYLTILQRLNGTPEARLHTVKIVAQFWRNNTQFMGILLDKMLNYRVVDAIAIVKWVFEPEVWQNEWHRSFVWDILKNTLNKVISRVAQVKDKLAEVRKEFEAVPPTKSAEVVQGVENTLSIVNREQKEVFLTLYQKFVAILQSKLKEIEGLNPGSEELEQKTRSYQIGQGWFLEVGRRYSKEVATFSSTLDAIVFSADSEAGEPIDPRIINIFQEICRMEIGRSVEMN
ncbi:Nuclear cap-binding protein subunit 1 [Lobosporangium transversale]|uniref:Armadillo-type protein n=1 Tax=Lobosporangium transversale TaxID=64571 RepID=A0A1Y2G5P3_9FUNG|nr:armadillo-type protein [Lobosporangium transversale]KAF9903314.1 Nuclear cap-binding protein subunit 1 [Lobosporangium transversale]ORY96031.1 armadillo-type protein [Lobosporangium transversale]|eukprot:XP_021875463.1 armadillo-type protein [Lobosporangium transversale]